MLWGEQSTLNHLWVLPVLGVEVSDVVLARAVHHTEEDLLTCLVILDEDGVVELALDDVLDAPGLFDQAVEVLFGHHAGEGWRCLCHWCIIGLCNVIHYSFNI